jgi:hypothetical protein
VGKEQEIRNIDGFVKSPSAVLRFIFRHFGARLSAPHSKRFARLASGAFYCAVSSRGFYETINIVLNVNQILDNRELHDKFSNLRNM